MKTLSNDGKYWIEEIDQEGLEVVLRVGITPDFSERIGTVWNFIPHDMESLKVGETFAHVETGRCLLGLKSPVAGKELKFNEHFMNNPHQLTHEEGIFEVVK